MLVTTTRNILLVLALFLTFLGPAAIPARAQTLTRAQVRKLLKIRFAQATAVFKQIEKEQQLLARFPAPIVQSAIAQDQAVLSQIQAQISLLEQLLADLDLAFAIDRLIQNVQKKGGGKGRSNGAVRRATIANLQASLSMVQAQISNLQSQIIP